MTRTLSTAVARELAINVEGLSKSFGSRHAVRNLSLQVRRGEIFGFLGPNGSGKTTSIRMLCGLLTPDAGRGSCLGFDILRQGHAIRRNVGYMTQRFSFWEDLSIAENLDFIARIYEIPNRAATVTRLLKAFHLDHRAGQLAGTLSGGWKQRLALAACMLHGPKLLLLDEPTAGVDPKTRRDFWEEIHQLASRGISVLVSTHYMDEAERCHKLGYIANGELRIEGTREQVIAASGLVTYSVTGARLAELGRALEALPGVAQTVIFGEALHVSGKEGASLAADLETLAARWREPFRYREIPTGLEEVFIHLMPSAPAVTPSAPMEAAHARA